MFVPNNPMDKAARVTAPTRAIRWRNLYFLRDGRTEWGTDIHETKAQAEAASARFFAEWAAFIADGGFEFCEMSWGGLVLYVDHLFSIPMPIQERQRQ